MITVDNRGTGTDRRLRGRRERARTSLRAVLEFLEDRLAPAGLVNGDFAISNPADPNYGWTTKGNASIANGQGILNEGTTVQTEFSQSFTIPQGTTALQFTIVANGLASNGNNSPPDAFEAALLNATNNQPLIGPATGLANSDAFLNIQQTGEVFFAPQVTVPGASTSGAVASLAYPELVTVDLSSLPANTQATLYFDLIGFSPASSSVRITDVTTLQGASPPPLTLALDPATDSGIKGDNLTNFDPVNLVGVTDPNQSVSLAIGSGGFTDGTTTADANGHFTFNGVNLAQGSNLVRVQATNGQGSTVASQTITVDNQPPTGTLVNPTPGTATNSDLGYVDVQWTSPGAAPIDPSTFSINNITVTGVTIDQVQSLGNNLERYLYNLNVNALPLGKITVIEVGGQIADTAGNVNPQSSQSFTLVSPTIQAPVANAQSVTTAENTALAITVAGSDPNTPPLSLTYTVTASPAHGTLGGNAPDLTYTPAAGYFGPDSFQFKGNNGSLDSNIASVTIAIVGQPVLIAPTVTTTQDGPVTITLNGQDPNVPPRTLTYTITQDPKHGTVSGTAPNLIYTPNVGFHGTDSFLITDSNGVATSSPAVVNITVLGPPTAAGQALTTAHDTAIAVTLSGTDPNNPPLPLSYIITTGPAHGTLSGKAPNLLYTPDAGYTGADGFQFKVNNGSLDSNVATVSITVNGTTPPPTATDGPRITSVKRYGYHTMPTRLVLVFNQPLDPTSAEDVNNYVILDPNGAQIPIASAVYNPARQAVTLHPSIRISIHYRYRVTVKGTGPKALRNPEGQLLDGASTGHPGSDYHLNLTWRQLVLGDVSIGFLKKYNLFHARSPQSSRAGHPAQAQHAR